MKKCKGCQKELPLSSYSTAGKGRHKPRCKPCNSDFVQNQKKTNQVTYLKAKYQLMLNRVNGVNPNAVTSVGKPILTLGQFLWWSFSSDLFFILHEAWVKSGFDYKLSPSIDRINPAKGYTLDNLQWLTHSENCAKDKFK